MAKRLGIHTLAEGVETKEQYEFLKRIGCELIQGYYFSKPLPLEDYQNKRAELCSFEKNETPEEMHYFDEIGRINFLDNTPLRKQRLDVASDIPIAIIEREDRKYKFIFINNAFLKIIQSFGAQSTDDVIARISANGNKDDAQERFKKLLYSEETHETVEFVEHVENLTIISKAKFLSRNSSKVAYAFVIRVIEN